VLPSLQPRAQLLSPVFLASLIVPPALFGGCWLGLRLKNRDPSVRRAQRALAAAQRRLKSAGAKPEESWSAFAEYFRDRLDLAGGELTPRELTATLTSRGVDPLLARSAAELLDRLSAARFGGASDQPLGGEAAALLLEIDRCLKSSQR
jgi:hypothetical protein